MRKIMEFLEVSPDECLALGDNYNDIEMLDQSDISIVMGEANLEVQKHADYVTKSPLEDGIMYALKKFVRSI